MEEHDKSFNEAIKDLSHHHLSFSTEEEMLDLMVKIGPVVQQAIVDGRTIESVVQIYFPEEAMQKAVLSIYRALMLRLVLDKTLKAGFLSQTQHGELLQFLQDLIPN